LATPGLDIRDIRINLWIISLLKFPAYQAVFYENLPTARHGTVHTMTRSHAVVVAPSFSIEFLPRTRVFADVKPVAVIVHDMPMGSLGFEVI
jgi:hypothetical protein